MIFADCVTISIIHLGCVCLHDDHVNKRDSIKAQLITIISRTSTVSPQTVDTVGMGRSERCEIGLFAGVRFKDNHMNYKHS